MEWWIEQAREQAIRECHQWVVFDMSRCVWDSTNQIDVKNMQIYPASMTAGEIWTDIEDYFESMRTP